MDPERITVMGPDDFPSNFSPSASASFPRDFVFPRFLFLAFVRFVRIFGSSARTLRNSRARLEYARTDATR